MSRPTKLDDLVEKRICDALSRGHSWASAARAAGVDESTVHEWRRRGRAGEERYAAFAQRVDAADHQAEQRAVSILTAKFDSDDDRVALAAAQWWLERRRPAEWGSKKAEVEEPLTMEEAQKLVAEAAEMAKRAG